MALTEYTEAISMTRLKTFTKPCLAAIYYSNRLSPKPLTLHPILLEQVVPVHVAVTLDPPLSTLRCRPAENVGQRVSGVGWGGGEHQCRVDCPDG